MRHFIDPQKTRRGANYYFVSVIVFSVVCVLVKLEFISSPESFPLHIGGC